MKSFIPCFVFAVVAQTLIYRAAMRQYSPETDALLTAVWGFGSLILAWFEPRLRMVYFGSVALSAPGISYSMLGYGFLEMGGLLHALGAGVPALAFHKMFQRFRASLQKHRSNHLPS